MDEYEGESDHVVLVAEVPKVESVVIADKDKRYSKSSSELSGVEEMGEPIIVGGGDGMGAGLGAGLGGGLLGGILGGALLGNRGLLGGNAAVADGCAVTPALLAASLAQVTDTANSVTVLQTLGDIKASIPLAEGQVQLALAGATADINGNINSSLQIAIAGQAGINKNISDAIATSLASQGAIKETIAAYGVANLTATKDSQFAVTQSINASTKEILAALNDQNTANLQRQLTVAETRLTEQNTASLLRNSEINITNTNTATAQQFQVQTQQQQQFQILANLAANVANLANDIQVVRQQQSTVNFGTMTGSGTQAAANTKVN